MTVNIDMKGAEKLNVMIFSHRDPLGSQEEIKKIGNCSGAVSVGIGCILKLGR
jgi:hypothetical protein